LQFPAFTRRSEAANLAPLENVDGKIHQFVTVRPGVTSIDKPALYLQK
jgi:hypothetical protein